VTVMQSAVGAPVPAPREWWQVWGERRVRWWAAHPVLYRRLQRLRAVTLWVGLVWLAGLLIFMPDLRPSVRAYLGCVWIAVAWFLLARTKTLTWSGYMRFFAVCVPWSVLIAVYSTWIAPAASPVIVVAGIDMSPELGVDAVGASVAIAAIVEEVGKLVPVALLALLAPRRAARFAVVDWVLLGVASGTAFLAAEETLRRLSQTAGDGLGLLGQLTVADDGLPLDAVRFGWWPLPTEMTGEFGAFGSHAVMTALVTGTFGLALAGWRRARGRRSRAGWILRPAVLVAVLVVPALVLWSAIADHAIFNAQHDLFASQTSADGTPVWLDPATTSLPWWFRAPWSWLGHGHGRQAVFLVLFVAAVLVDARRLARYPEIALWAVAPPAWLAVSLARVRDSVAGLPVAGHLVAGLVEAAGLLVWTAGRDVREVLAVAARAPGETRREALARMAAVVAAQRAARELAYEHHAGRVRPWMWRVGAAAVLAGLGWAALHLAPVTAAEIGNSLDADGPFWLAGVLDSLADWWNDQPLITQLAIGAGVAALIVLSGGSLALALGLSGVLTWALDHGHGLAALTRDPRGAIRDYFTTATPAQIVLDTLGTVLTFLPGNFVGAKAAQGIRYAITDIAADPGLWRAQLRADLATGGERGAIDLAAWDLNVARRTIRDEGLGPGDELYDALAELTAAQKRRMGQIWSTFPGGTDDVTKAAWYRDAARADGIPDHMRAVLDGRAFNHEMYPLFDAHEVTIHKIDPDTGRVLERFRVDALDDAGVVSLKNTQIAEVKPETVKDYVNEMLKKYKPREKSLVIAPTDGNKAQLDASELGESLEGQMFLGVPKQNAPIPQDLLDYAARKGVRFKQLPPPDLPGGAS
jgi:hypothetical protein